MTGPGLESQPLFPSSIGPTGYPPSPGVTNKGLNQSASQSSFAVSMPNLVSGFTPRSSTHDSQ